VFYRPAITTKRRVADLDLLRQIEPWLFWLLEKPTNAQPKHIQLYIKFRVQQFCS